MDVRAGIFWDPREPLPEGIEVAIDAAHGLGAYHRYGGGVGVLGVHAHHENRYLRRPPDRQQQRVLDGVDDVAIPKPPRNNLPPLSVSVTAQVVQDTAKVTVTQLFWNKSNEAILEAAYTFPLSAGCTVTRFSCRIGSNRIMKAKVKSKPAARDAFNELVRTSRSAGLLEQGTPEIFTTTLGNIPANTKLGTEITYITLLKHKFADKFNTTTLTIPTNIAPRYGSPPLELQNTPISGLSHGISIKVDVVAEETPHDISSKSHKITIERVFGRNLYDNWAEFATTDGANDVEVSLVKLEDGRTFLDKDFVLDIAREQHNGLETPTAWLETHPTLANHKAVMLTIPPKFMLRNQSSNPDGEIIFLADRSGSMSDKMESLKSAMNFFLKGIPQARKFNIWCFGSNYTSLWPQSVEYSEEALQEAMVYVSGQFRSDMGGTQVLGALRAIVRGRNQGSRMVDIVILTDGEVWALDETVSFVQDTSRSSEGRTRFFALGIGDAVSHELVEGIAKAGGGYAEVVPAASQGGWEDRVVAMLGAALTGHVGAFRIEYDGQGEDPARGIHLRDRNCVQAVIGPKRPVILQSPADFSTLSPFLRNRAFMLYDSAREPLPLDHIDIKVTALGGEEIITRVPIVSVERKDSTLHKLGARALLGDLERGQSWIRLDPYAPPLGSTQEQELVRQEGEALGLKWSLVSKWTSFYAVEEPYHAAENARIPFLDAEDIQIREAVGDLDLLRPRGAAAQRANFPAGPLPAVFAAVEADEGSDEDEDTASDSDHIDMGADGDGDSDSDDGGNDGDGGDTGGNQAAGSEGDQQKPEPGDSNADGNGGATGGNPDTQNDAAIPNAPHLAALDRGTSENAREDSAAGFFGESGVIESSPYLENTQNARPEAADHTIKYDSPLAPILPRTSGPVTMRSSDSLPGKSRNHVRSTDFSHQRSLAAIARAIPSPASPSIFRRRGQSHYSKDHKSAEHYNSLGLAPSERTSSRPTTSSPESRDVKVRASLKDEPSAWNSSDYHHDTSADNQPQHSYDSLYTLPSFQSATDKYPSAQSDAYAIRNGSNSPQALPPQSAYPSTDMAFGALPYRSRGVSNDWDSGSVNSNPQARSQSTTITAPSFNMPASTAMHSNESRAPRSEEEVAGEQKIRNLLVFQLFDGSFNFDSVEQLSTHLGPDFVAIVQHLQLQADFKLALTVGLMLVLEEKFEYCRDLWTLVYNKANDYLKRERPLEFSRIVLLGSARPQVRMLAMSRILQKAASTQPVVLPPAREQFSTLSSSSHTGSLDGPRTKPRIGINDTRSWEGSGAAVGSEASTNRVVLDTAPIEEYTTR